MKENRARGLSEGSARVRLRKLEQINELIELVREEPGIPEIVAAWLMRRHYSDHKSAVECIRSGIKRGLYRGVERRIDSSGTRWCLWPKV